jgi:hypothetical protein
MVTRVKSARSARWSKRKHSTLGRRLIASLKEALEQPRGELVLPSYIVMVPPARKRHEENTP